MTVTMADSRTGRLCELLKASNNHHFNSHRGGVNVISTFIDCRKSVSHLKGISPQGVKLNSSHPQSAVSPRVFLVTISHYWRRDALAVHLDTSTWAPHKQRPSNWLHAYIATWGWIFCTASINCVGWTTCKISSFCFENSDPSPIMSCLRERNIPGSPHMFMFGAWEQIYPPWHAVQLYFPVLQWKGYFIVPLLKSLLFCCSCSDWRQPPRPCPPGTYSNSSQEITQTSCKVPTIYVYMYVPYCPKQAPTAQARWTLARALFAHIHVCVWVCEHKALILYA